jgi:hypothetical protein
MANSDVTMWITGARVRTRHQLDPAVRDGQDPSPRRTDILGTVDAWSTAAIYTDGKITTPAGHGVLVYRVKHDDGSSAWYTGDELGQP